MFSRSLCSVADISKINNNLYNSEIITNVSVSLLYTYTYTSAPPPPHTYIYIYIVCV